MKPYPSTCEAWIDDDCPPCGEPATIEREGQSLCTEHAWEHDVGDVEGLRTYLRTVALP